MFIITLNRMFHHMKCYDTFVLVVMTYPGLIQERLYGLAELQIKKNSCQTLGPASKRVLPDLLFFLEFF